jgi:molecular chaperone DnaK
MDTLEDTLVGIDFGTTNTVISIFENNKVKILNDSIYKTIPSKIGFMNNNIYCGNYIPVNCSNIIHSFKITIGSNEKQHFIVGDMKYTHMDLLIIFFQHIRSIICTNLSLCDMQSIRCVITVPSNFNDMQRELIKQCFNYVKLNVIRIINEPSAAALAYGLNHSSKENEKILVIDTGGGTMDFTILEKTDLFFEVIHSEGLNTMGGNNFTEVILKDNKELTWNQAQLIKEKLTYLENYEINISEKKYNLSRFRFENLCSELIKKVEEILTNITNEYNDIDYVVLVGGTSRIPILQSTIKYVCGMNPWIHPSLESVVAEGAGLYCGIIENKFTTNNDVILMDVLPLSLGVELVDGTYSIIIPKNTPLPVKRSQKYTTESNEKSINIKVYQGERKIASKNFLIGEFIFDKVTMGCIPIIEISFKVDLNSIINVTVVDKKSGIEKSIIIKDIPIIDIEHINKIIETAVKLDEMDMNEMIRNQNIYLIRSHIEKALINLSINNLINENDKDKMLLYFKTIEDSYDSMNNLQLIDTLTELQDKYSILGSAHINEVEENNVDNFLYQEKKEELKSRVELLLAKNPYWEEFLTPVLNELTYTSCSFDYIVDKLKVLDEMETCNTDEKDYKMEVNNLCLYLKSQIEIGSINMGDNNILLITLINDTLILLTENVDVDWKEQLEKFNKNCEEIYKK